MHIISSNFGINSSLHADSLHVPPKKTLFGSLFVFKNCFSVFNCQNIRCICLCHLQKNNF